MQNGQTEQHVEDLINAHAATKEPDSESAPELTEADIKALIEKQRAERVKRCEREIEAVLVKHRCRIVPTVIIQAGRHPQAILQITAEDN